MRAILSEPIASSYSYTRGIGVREEKNYGAERNLPDFFPLCPTCQKTFSLQTFRQKVKDKDREGARQLRNLSVTRGLLAQSQLWQSGRGLMT